MINPGHGGAADGPEQELKTEDQAEPFVQSAD
jgi:hypothetical protein